MVTRRSKTVLLMFVMAGCSPMPAPTDDQPETKVSAVAEASSQSDDERQQRKQPDDQTVPDRPVPENSVYRRPDDRPDLNERRLAEAGIHRLESRRLVLLTDRSPDSVRHLMPLADALFDFLSVECGPLHPAADGSEFQVTGCLIDDETRFHAAELMPDETVELNHGLQRGYRFWMRHQEDNYYVRHLLLHEFTHCFMHSDQQELEAPPNWFLEGAAEVFATHVQSDDSSRFGVMPKEWTGFEGWGRVSEILRQLGSPVAEDFSLRSVPALHDVRNPDGAFARDDARYAFWWAYCRMLRHHPDYSELWRSLCRAGRSGDVFVLMNDAVARSGDRMSTDWLLFAESLCEGFDPERGFAKHRNDSDADSSMKLAAGFGWQDTGHDLERGDKCRIECSGSCVLATTTQPWVSEPQGITIAWNRGRPTGEVVAVLTGDGISSRLPVGRERTIVIPRAGRLWLQVNDAESDRTDNSGSYNVRISVE